MAGSLGRKTVSVSRGLMMLCETCFDQVYTEKLPDARNFIADHEALMKRGGVYAGLYEAQFKI